MQTRYQVQRYKLGTGDDTLVLRISVGRKALKDISLALDQGLSQMQDLD